MATTENEAALREALDAWNAGNLDRYMEVYDESVVLHGFAPQPIDKPAVRAFYELVQSAFDGPQLTGHDVFGEGDSLVVRYTLTGTHRGDFMGIPATGRDVAVDGITIMHFRDGKCVERWNSADMLGWLVQLGAVEPPAA